MSADVSRRDVLRGVLATGGALCIGVTISGCGSAQKRRIRHADNTGELDVNMYITVLPTGLIRLAVNKAEIGQGVVMAYTTMVAEELEVEREGVGELALYPRDPPRRRHHRVDRAGLTHSDDRTCR